MKWVENPKGSGLYSAKLTPEEITMKVAPKLNAMTPRDKNKTEQVVCTDPRLFKALHDHFGFTVDLACNKDNCLCDRGITEAEDSLSVDWYKLSDGFMWLNPPFNQCGIWAEKCAREMERGAKIIMLAPASVGSNWFRDNIYKKARVRFLTGRLTFVGHKSPYPKDCMIAIYDGINFGLDIWNWREGWE